MVTHIVFFKCQNPGDIAAIAELLRSLQGKVPSLRAIEVGVDQLQSERSFDVALLTRFDSWADLDAYQVHPEHQRVLQGVRALGPVSKTVDWETPAS